MSPSPTAADALERLVDQFTEPLSFYRELVQNALDAGSAEVDVSLVYRDGVALIRVDDYGEGMTREIIEGRLTRLFSSRKDGDLTLVGKFGIGFVSVFAIRPDAVSVDTSREGQNWRVLFHRDRSFSLIARDQPVDGTKIQILKRVTEPEFEELLARSREVITYWCRFVDAEVRFQGEVINQPFALDSPCQVRHREPGTEIVVGYRRDLRPFFGFYNRGLTLLEGGAEYSHRAAILVDSRYLEHTMARDDVRRDEGFFKAMAIADRLLDEALPRRLAEMLQAALAAGRVDEELDFLCRALARNIEPERQWSWTAAELAHGGGHAEEDAWVAVPGEDRLSSPAHLVYGPYCRDVPPGRYRAHWWLALEAGDEVSRGVTLDVWDAHAKRALAERAVAPGDLRHPGEVDVVALDFRCDDGAVLELRTLWHGAVAVRQLRVAVTGGEPVDLDDAGFAPLPLFRTPDGRPVTLGEAARAVENDRLLTAAIDSPVVTALEGEGFLVLAESPGTSRWEILEALAGRPLADAHRRYCLPRPVSRAEDSWGPLRSALVGLLRRHGAKIYTAVLGRFDDPGSTIRDRVAVSVTTPGQLTEIRDTGTVGRGLLGRRQALVVNVAHPTVRQLLRIARQEPEVAAYLLAKLFFLRTELEPRIDARLAALAWEQRWSRLQG